MKDFLIGKSPKPSFVLNKQNSSFSSFLTEDEQQQIQNMRKSWLQVNSCKKRQLTHWERRGPADCWSPRDFNSPGTCCVFGIQIHSSKVLKCCGTEIYMAQSCHRCLVETSHTQITIKCHIRDKVYMRVQRRKKGYLQRYGGFGNRGRYCFGLG